MRSTIPLLLAALLTTSARPVTAATIVYNLVFTLDPGSTGPLPSGTFQVNNVTDQALLAINWESFTFAVLLDGHHAEIPTDCPGVGSAQYLALLRGICPSGTPRYFLDVIGLNGNNGMETDELTFVLGEGNPPGGIIAAPIPFDFTPGTIGVGKQFMSTGTLIIPAGEPRSRGLLVIGLIAAAIVAAVYRQRRLSAAAVSVLCPADAEN